MCVVVDSAHECREENKCIKSELVLSIASDLKRTWIIKTKVERLITLQAVFILTMSRICSTPMVSVLCSSCQLGNGVITGSLGSPGVQDVT